MTGDFEWKTKSVNNIAQLVEEFEIDRAKYLEREGVDIGKFVTGIIIKA